MAQDISNILSGTGVQLEQQAVKQFGAAVDSSSTGALSKALGVNRTSTQDAQTVVGQNGVWSPTHYASALVKHDQVEFNPKLKFMFKVSFEFDPSMIDAARRMGHDIPTIQQNFSFLIRHIDRPKHDFEYEEVNMYNFRTSVLKAIRGREVGFTVYDDVGNAALSFVNIYRKLLQPIARAQQDPFAKFEDHTFAFDGTYSGLDTSMRGVLPANKKNVLTKMTIHQIFVERGSKLADPASWVKVVDFVFVNPRFTNIDIDDLDHENGGSFNIITISANYDTMFMSEPFTYTQDKAGPNLRTGDIPANSASGANGNPAGKTNNPFMDIIANQGNRAIQSGTSNILNNSLKKIPGGSLLSGQLPGVQGALGEAGTKTISSMTSGITQSFARPSAPLVVDTNTSPSAAQDLSSRVSSENTGDFSGVA